MACNIPEILKQNNVKVSTNDLKKLVAVFDDPKSTSIDKKLILNSIIHNSIRLRNNLLNAAFKNKIPKKLQLTVSPIPITQSDIDSTARNNRNAAASILVDTLPIGRAKQTLSDFVNSTKHKLNILFNKSRTLFEYMESPEYATFVETASKEDIKVFQYLIFNSRKLDEFFYGEKDSNPILDYMADTKEGRTAFNFAVLADQKSRTDLFKYLLKRDENEKLIIDPLVLEAINLAVYNWQTTQARTTYFNGATEINRILGRDSKAVITPEEWAHFSEAGVLRAAAIDSIGKEAYTLLGFEPKNDVEGNFSNKLQLALGEMGIAFMLENDILEQVRIPASAFENKGTLNDSQQDISSAEVDTVFIKVKDKTLIDQISDNRQETKVPKELFDLDTHKIFPSTKPAKSTPTFMRRTKQKIAEKTTKVIEQLQKDKWEVKTAVSDKLFSISESLRNNILGIIEDVEAEHILNRKKVEAENNKINQTLEDFLLFNGSLNKPDTAFYLNYFVSKVGRIFIDNNTLNPLQNTIVRHLIGLKNYNVSVNSEPLRIQYKLAVAQAFGFDIDKKALPASLLAFESFLADTKEAVEALKNDELTTEQETLVKDAIELGGEGIHTFEALISLGNYSATESFDTNLAIETDAVTSGVAIGIMQSLLDGVEDLPSVGVYTDGEQRSFPEWKSLVGNFDLYEKLAQVWSNLVTATVNSSFSLRPKAYAIRGIIDSFMDTEGLVTSIGRKFSKDPLMVTNYGSEIKNARTSFSQAVLDKFYDEVSKTLNPQIYYDYATAIIGEELQIDSDTKPQDFVLTRKQTNLFLSSVDSIYGSALQEALEERLGSFITFRNNINKAFQVMFYVFESKFKIELAKKQEEVGGRILSIEEQDEVLESVRKYFPVVKGALSKGLDDGILIIKGGLRRQYNNNYKGQQQYTRPIKNTGGVNSITSHATAYEFTNPGAAATVSQIHNLDSAIQQAMLSTVEAMNIHDAGLYALTDVDKGTKTYNQAFIETNIQHSVLEETWKSYKRILALAVNTPEIHADLAAALKSNIFRSRKKSVNEQRQNFELDFINLLQEVTANREELANTALGINNAAHPTDTVYEHGLNPNNLEKEIGSLIDQIFDNTKGSSSRNIDFDNFVALFEETINNTTLIPLFDQLNQIGSKQDAVEHTERLKEILTNLVRVQGNIDLKVGETNTESAGVLRTFSDGVQDVHILGSVSTFRNNAQLSAQEIYVHELVHAVTEFGIDTNASIRNALKRLYTQAKGRFTYVDFLPDTVGPPTAAEIATAKETYDYIFNNTKGATGVRSTKSANPYLHEFVAYGLTNANFIKKLSTIPVRDKKKKATTLSQQLINWFNGLLEYVVDRIHGIDGLSSDKALRKLVDKMMSTNERNRTNILKIFEVLNGANEKLINLVMSYILAPAVAYRKKPVAPHIPGRVLHTMLALLDHDVYIEVGKIIKQVTRNIGLTEKSFIVKLVREVQGLTEENEVWHSLLRLSKKVIDQARVHEAVNVTKHINSSFHTDISREESTTLYKVFMKTDLVSLLDTFEKGKYTPDKIIQLLNDPSVLGKTIADLEQEIKKSDYGDNVNYYLKQAKGLGNLMTLGKDFVAGQMKNAFLIANLNNVEQEVQGDIKKAESLIDELVTLYAINNISKEQRAQAGDIYSRENAVDGLQNGITNLLYLHNLNKKESLDMLFDGKKAQIEKGYTRETFNPNIDVKISPKIQTHIDPVSGVITHTNLEKQLNDEGYIRIDDNPLPKDPLDPSPDARYLFVSSNSPNATWVKSVVSLTAQKHKGTTIDEIFSTVDSNTAYIDGQQAIANIDKRVRKEIKRQFKNKDTESSLLPIVDSDGKTVNYRYVMSEHTKETVMERDNRFDYSMGRMFGVIQDKTNSKDINRQVLTIAKEDFDENFLANPSDYVDIGPGSTDPELAEIYSLLPADMKLAMTEIWGAGNPIQIKAEFVNLVFGFRKLRFNDMNNFIGAATRGVNQSLTWLLQNTFFPESNNVDIGKLWTEVVNIAKEMIVVKSGVILLPNFISNNIILLTKGVKPSAMAKHQTEAVLELEKYHKDLSKRDILARELKANTSLTKTQRTKKEAELARLNTDLFSNPVRELIDEGIFQSIIEDLDFEEDLFTSRAKLGNKIQDIADKYLPEFTVTAAKHVYFTKDTTPYQVLLKAVQVSDFFARYALYKHRIDNAPKTVKTKEQKEAFKRDAINEIIETFVNYDVPTSKEMQWINDMGLLMFTKFYFRIQKVIFKMFKERPASAIAGLMIQELTGDVEDIADSFIGPGMLNRANTPFDIVDQANDIPLWGWVT